MRISRAYLFGLGSGLILSALIAMVLPSVNIQWGETLENPNQKTPSIGHSSETSPTNTATVNGANPASVNPTPPVQGNNSDNTSKEQKTTVPELKEGFVVPAGASAEKIADLLLKEGWITAKEGFLDIIKQRNLASKFKAGNFELTRGTGTDEIISQLIK